MWFRLWQTDTYAVSSRFAAGYTYGFINDYAWLAGLRTITGGAGADLMDGGAGNNTFVFNTNDIDPGETVTFGTSSDIFRVDSSENFYSLNAQALLAGLDVISLQDTEAYFNSPQLSGLTLTITDKDDGVIGKVTVYGDALANTIDVANITHDSNSALYIDASAGNDSVTGSAFADEIFGSDDNDTISGGVGNDNINGGAGIDRLYGGDGTDALIIAATSDDAVGELYDGGNGTDDYLYISGTAVVDLRDDTVTNVETLNMSGSSSAQTLTLLASQLSGFTLNVSADSSDSITVYNMTGGAMSASGGTDTFVWGNSDYGMNRISGFNRYTDKLRFDFVLNQGSDGAAVTTVDGTNDLSANSLLYVGFGVWSFAQASKAAYVMYLSIGDFDAATASGNAANTTNGIDFATASEANILANIEAALENTSEGGGVGVISRVNGSGVINGAAGTDIVFLLDDGNDTAVIRYQEGVSAEADYAGELTLLGVITGNTGGNFNPSWNGNIYALFA